MFPIESNHAKLFSLLVLVRDKIMSIELHDWPRSVACPLAPASYYQKLSIKSDQVENPSGVPL